MKYASPAYPLYRSRSNYGWLGVTASVALHLTCGLMLFFAANFFQPRQLPQVVYSVSVEGGRSLGGIQQLAKVGAKGPVAPPKRIGGSPPPKDTPPASQDKVNEPVKEERKPDPPAPVPSEARKNEAAPESVVTPATTPEKNAARATPPPATSPRPQATKEQKKRPQREVEDPNEAYQRAMQRYLGESSDGGGSGFGAARIGGSGMGGGVVRPPEFFSYLRVVRSRVRDGWRWFDGTSSLVATVEFDLSPDGSITGERIVQASGNAEFDRSIIRAIRAADPLPPPPPSVYDYFRRVQIVFDPREY